MSTPAGRLRLLNGGWRSEPVSRSSASASTRVAQSKAALLRRVVRAHICLVVDKNGPEPQSQTGSTKPNLEVVKDEERDEVDEEDNEAVVVDELVLDVVDAV